MPIDWPSAPAVDDTYTFAGITWRWNGKGWIAVGGSGGSSDYAWVWWSD
jgi:hypothetical protein